MRTVQDIRHENLLAAIQRAGTQTALAERAGLSTVYLSQLKTRAVDSKSQRPREIGNDAARAIERAIGEQPGWMDQDHSRASQIERGLSFVEWFDSLSPDDKIRFRDVAKLVVGKAIPDDVVEERMPITKRVAKENGTPS
jgi:hypothetical protein